MDDADDETLLLLLLLPMMIMAAFLTIEGIKIRRHNVSVKKEFFKRGLACIGQQASYYLQP